MRDLTELRKENNRLRSLLKTRDKQLEKEREMKEELFSNMLELRQRLTKLEKEMTLGI